MFLRIDPYWFRIWWTKVLYEPFCYGTREPLVHAVTQVLWRNSKDDVYDQVTIFIYTNINYNSYETGKYIRINVILSYINMAVGYLKC